MKKIKFFKEQQISNLIRKIFWSGVNIEQQRQQDMIKSHPFDVRFKYPIYKSEEIVKIFDAIYQELEKIINEED